MKSLRRTGSDHYSSLVHIFTYLNYLVYFKIRLSPRLQLEISETQISKCLRNHKILTFVKYFNLWISHMFNIFNNSVKIVFYFMSQK